MKKNSSVVVEDIVGRMGEGETRDNVMFSSLFIELSKTHAKPESWVRTI